MAHIAPLEPPFDDELAQALERWMPPGSGMEPLALFRVLAHHRDLLDRMRPLGAGLLGRGRLSPRDRELLIHRTTARAGAGYEWGVHAVAFGRGVAGLTEEQLRSTAIGSPDDAAWDDAEEDRLVLRVADALYDHDTITADLWPAVNDRYPTDMILEMVICCGWYRLLAGVIRTAGLEPEPWAQPFPQLVE